MSNIILAPHIDDEMIGCYQLILSGNINRIIYFFDLTDERRKEALDFCSSFGILCDFSGTTANIQLDDILFVPSISDSHPHHKIVNGYAKSLPNKKFYYSVDMTNPKLLDPVLQENKLKDLIKYYPTQHNLIISDDKYHLFEKISEYDITIFLKVTTQFEGFHYYINAPNDVSFLRNNHRHMFHITCYVEQFHDNRDIEYIQFKRWLESSIASFINDKSCEQLAMAIKDIIHGKYGYNRKINVEVTEDGENGAFIEDVI